MAEADNGGQELCKLFPCLLPVLWLTAAQYDLPKQARAYIEFIGEFVGVPVGWVGTGPAREDMIVLHGADAVLA